MSAIKNLFFTYLLIFCVFAVSYSLQAFSSSSGKGQENPSLLARSVVLDFANSSSLSEDAYLSRSISDAIRTKFNKVFEYKKVSKREVAKSFSSILKKAKRKWYQMELPDIKALAKKQKLDVVIYGSYDRITGRKRNVDDVEIITNIYFTKKDQNIILDKQISEINPNVLTAIDKVAEHSIDKIKEIIDVDDPIAEENLEDKAPAILVNATKDQRNSPKASEELDYIRLNLKKEHGQKVIFLPDYLKKNKGIKPPKSVKDKSSLVRWSKEYKIKKIVHVRVKTVNGLVQVGVINKGRPKKEVQYELNAPLQVKKEKLIQMKELLKILKKRKKKIDLSVAALSKQAWGDVAHEVGLNPFYQITLGNVGSLSPWGGGVSLYYRTSLKLTAMLLYQLWNKKDQPLTHWIFDSLFWGTHFSANYFQRTFNLFPGTADIFFQNYLISFEAGFLYPFTNKLRAGLSLRPGYYIGSSSRNLGTISTKNAGEALYSGFVLPVFLR